MGAVGGVITIGADGGIMELDPAGDRRLLDISGFADDGGIPRANIRHRRLQIGTPTRISVFGCRTALG